MKRLLLAPLLIALSGCTSDIVVKTDLGEKYIAKKSAIMVAPRNLNYLIASIKEDELKNRAAYFRCVRNLGGRKNPQEFSYCENTYAFWNGYSNVHSVDLDLIRSQSSKVKSDETLWFDITFRPIFIDLNKKKNALDYEEFSCLKENYLTKVFGDKYLNLSKRQPKELSGIAYESMKVKLCKKYAKFE